MGMDVNKLIGEMQQMQEQIEGAGGARERDGEGHRRRGIVTVKATGALEIVEVKIDPEAIDPDDPELLADMIQAAATRRSAPLRP